jgi:hypothetical protein
MLSGFLTVSLTLNAPPSAMQGRRAWLAMLAQLRALPVAFHGNTVPFVPHWRWSEVLAHDLATLVTATSSCSMAVAPPGPEVLEVLVALSSECNPVLRRASYLALQLMAANPMVQQPSLHGLLTGRLSQVAEACLLAESSREFDLHFQEAVHAAGAAIIICGEQALSAPLKDATFICDPCECICLAASLAAAGACSAQLASPICSRGLHAEVTQIIPLHSLVGMVHWAQEGAVCMSQGALLFHAQCTAALVLLIALLGGFDTATTAHRLPAVDDVLAMASQVLAAPSPQVHQHLALLLVQQV